MGEKCFSKKPGLNQRKIGIFRLIYFFRFTDSGVSNILFNNLICKTPNDYIIVLKKSRLAHGT